MRKSPGNRWLAAAAALLGLTLAVPAQAAGVTVGDVAPDFRLQDQQGQWHSLANHHGQWIILYFYPKDQTPGCTKEACSFRDNIFAFEAMGAVVLGVSLDDVASHDEFAKKYSLPFPLLADTSGAVTSRYGVMGGFGPIRMAKRQSFLISPDGKIARHYESVEPEKHSAEVLADLKVLGAKKSS